MKRILILLVFIVSGCAVAADNRQYFDYQFQEWQERTRKEWTAETVDDIANSIRQMSLYRLEGNRDHWQTLDEWIDGGCRGDCEDVALSIASTLKRLGYPHRVELVIRRLWLENGYHAVVRVEMPDETFRTYETVPLYPMLLCAFSHEVLAYEIAYPNATK